MAFAFEPDDDLDDICELCAKLTRDGVLAFGICGDCLATFDPDARDHINDEVDCDVCDGSGRVLKGEGLGFGPPSLHADDGGPLGDQTEDCGECLGTGVL